MCKLCDEGKPQDHSGSRRNFMKVAAATGVAATGLNPLTPLPAAATTRYSPAGCGKAALRQIVIIGAEPPFDAPLGVSAAARLTVCAY